MEEKGNDMVICDFTQTEINYFIEKCNFTDSETSLFLLRSKNIPLVQCSIRMNMSLDGVKKLSRKVNRKIIKSI